MDTSLNKEELAFQSSVREFALREIQPLAAELDREARYPIETLPKLAAEGLMGMLVPKTYGGSALGDMAFVLAIEEISKLCASTGVICSSHNALATWPLLTYGNEAQKEKYLVPLAKGEQVGAFCLTEPHAGTDAGGMEIRAVLEGDHWVLNGKKIFITNGSVASVYVVFAMTDPAQGTHGGISAFIVEKDSPGFRRGKKFTTMGIKGSHARELFFENCVVPKENLLGELGRGFQIAMNTLNVGRIGIAAQALGIAQGALDVALAYIKEREQFGRKLAKFQALQFAVAEMETRICAARFLVYAAAHQKAAGLPFAKEAAMAKLFASETAMEVTTRAVQLFGGIGYTDEQPVERMMRDAKITEIYEGTSEVQKMVISGALLK